MDAARPNPDLKALMAEHGMSARQLADAVNRAEETLFGTPGNATDRHVRRWLSGEVTTPRMHYLAALTLVFDVPPPRLGFVLTDDRLQQLASVPGISSRPPISPQEQEPDPMQRRHFLIVATGTLVSFGCAPLPAAGRIGTADVTRIRENLVRLHAIDDEHGGKQLADIAETLIQQIQRTMARCTYGPRVEQSLYQTLGELHAAAGWFAFDSSEHDRAGRHFDGGLRDALLAGDRGLQARIWSSMARQSWELGRATETLTIAQAALNATRSGRDPRLSALLHGRLALGHAAAGESARSASALARAEGYLDKARGTPPPWLAFIGPGELLGTASMAGLQLSRPREAARHEEQSLALLGPRFDRNRYATRVHLARCQLAAGQPDQAIATASQALDLSGKVRCERWAVKLRAFRDNVATMRLPEATAFVERYDALLPTV